MRIALALLLACGVAPPPADEVRIGRACTPEDIWRDRGWCGVQVVSGSGAYQIGCLSDAAGGVCVQLCGQPDSSPCPEGYSCTSDGLVFSCHHL